MRSLIDLHTHSLHSDGVLAPAALVRRAAGRGVTVLALTDHDTTSGLPEAAVACVAAGIRFVPGIEVTATWRGQSIHVIGLGLPDSRRAVDAHAASVVDRRRHRVLAIGERLGRRARLDGAAIGEAVCRSHPVPTRTHLARVLVEQGHAPNVQAAFDRFLSQGAPGHVPSDWPTLADTMGVLVPHCAAVVLAHPHRYRLSGGALRQLASEFAGAGGSALEVDLAGMSSTDRDRIAALARRTGLAGSVGSDFHDPAIPWTPLGRTGALPEGVRAVPGVAPPSPLS
jgi:hypothetical protein